MRFPTEFAFASSGFPHGVVGLSWSFFSLGGKYVLFIQALLCNVEFDTFSRRDRKKQKPALNSYLRRREKQDFGEDAMSAVSSTPCGGRLNSNL